MAEELLKSKSFLQFLSEWSNKEENGNKKSEFEDIEYYNKYLKKINKENLKIGKLINYPYIDDIMDKYKILKTVLYIQKYRKLCKRYDNNYEYVFKEKEHSCTDLKPVFFDNSKIKHKNKKNFSIEASVCHPVSLSYINQFIKYKPKDYDEYNQKIYVCIFGKIHDCRDGMCHNRTLEPGGSGNKICNISKESKIGFSVFNRGDKKTMVPDDTNLFKSNESIYFNIKQQYIYKEKYKNGTVKKYDVDDDRLLNNYYLSELINYLVYHVNEIISKNNQGVRFIRTKVKTTILKNKKRKRKTYSKKTSSKRSKRIKNTEKHNNNGFQNISASKSISKNKKKHEKIVLYHKITKSLKTNPPIISKLINVKMNNKKTKLFTNIEFWYLSFLFTEPFETIINKDKSSILSLRDHHDANIFPNNKEYRNVFLEAIKIIKTLTPGLYRLKMEIKNILSICKNKFKNLTKYLKECNKSYVMPNYFTLLKDARFEYWNYKLILTEYMEDEEILEIVNIIIWFWHLCKRSDYIKKQNVQCLNITNHCIAVIYNMIKGLQYNDHTIIPTNLKFSRNGCLVPLNSLNDYGYSRRDYNNGTKILHGCIYDSLKKIPISKIQPFNKKINL